MINTIIIVILVAIAAAIIFYLIRQKKRGAVCIGCPHAKQCSHKEEGGCCGCMNK